MALRATEPADIPWRQLIEVTKKQQGQGATTSELDWMERVRAQVILEGWSSPRSRRLYQAIDAVKAASRKRRPMLAAGTYRQGPARPLVASLSPTLSASSCGCSKPVSGRSPLRCNRDAGHAPPHGVRLPSGELIVRWD